MRQVYLDNNATTAVRSAVWEAMAPYACTTYANPASLHTPGRQAAAGLSWAREQVAALLNASAEEIVFNACGTEGNNQALIGTLEALGQRDEASHIVTSEVEHPAVLDVCAYLEKNHGCEVTYLPVDDQGLLTAQQVETALRPHTKLISLMWANNETGVVFPIAEIGQVARKHGVRFHCDAVQAVGKVPVDVQAAGVDILTLSAHKFGGPKGVGAMYVRPKVALTPLLHGGHQEDHLRAGTHNVPGIVGLGKAAQLAAQRLPTEQPRQLQLRQRLEQALAQQLADVHCHGAAAPRLPNTANFGFYGVEGESLLLALDMAGIAVSTGSACTSDEEEPSHVLTAMGVSSSLAQSSLRFSLGLDTGVEDIDYVVDHLVPLVQRLREMSPLYAQGDEEQAREKGIYVACDIPPEH